MYSNSWRRINAPMSEREIVLRSWENMEDVAIIKNVATKGKYINMCIEFLARRRKCTAQESTKYFHSNVELYVNRLLYEKLLCKAEDVLKNVGRNYKFYCYQSAFETSNEEVKEAILNHLQKRNPDTFEEEFNEMKIYWSLLRDMAQNTSKFKDVADRISHLSFENIFKETESFRQDVIVRAYFLSSNPSYIPKLEKTLVWNHIVKESILEELAVWSSIFCKKSKNLDVEIEFESALKDRYFEWDIDEDMFEKAVNTISNPNEVVRNVFIANGYVFRDEKDDTRIILNRLFTTQSYNDNQSLVDSLTIEKAIFESGHFPVLLEDFIKKEKLEEVKTTQDESAQTDIDLILNLREEKETINSKDALVAQSRLISGYLLTAQKNFYKNSPIVFLTELLLDNSDDQNLLTDKEIQEILNEIPYMKSLIDRINDKNHKSKVIIPMLVKKFNGIDLEKVLSDAGNEPVHFFNTNLCKLYTRNVKIDFRFYLMQQRSAYAVYNLIMTQLKGFLQISTPQLYSAAKIAMELAIVNYRDPEQVSHCVAFIEMVGFDSIVLRSYISMLRFWEENKTDGEVHPGNYTEAISFCEMSLLDKMNENFPLRLYTAIRRVRACFLSKNEPDMILKKYANENDFWHLLMLLQYFDAPVGLIKRIIPFFESKDVGNNFERALLYKIPAEKPIYLSSFTRSEHGKKYRYRRNSSSHTTSGETLASSISSTQKQYAKKIDNSAGKFIQHSNDLDIFGIILLSTTRLPEMQITSFSMFIEYMNDEHIYSTSINLMKNAVRYKLPVLVILATIVCDEVNVEWCWLAWLLVKIDRFPKSLVNFETFVFTTMEDCIKTHHVRALHNSFLIFFEESKFTYFTKFLLETEGLEFGYEQINDLRNYLLAMSNEEIKFSLRWDNELPTDDLVMFTVKMLTLHLKYSFKSSYHQKLFLDIVCQAEMSEITGSINFHLLKKIHEIVMGTEVKIDFQNIPVLADFKEEIADEYLKICAELENLKHFQKAIEVAGLLEKSMDCIVYDKWIHGIEQAPEDLNMVDYEKEAEIYSLPPEGVIRFYLYIANNMNYDEDRKYTIYKRALEIIKKNRLFPNEDFDRDKIEYDMVLCYLKGTRTIDNLDVYHSEYFEEVFLKERCVLYKTFLELKEMAGVEDLNITNKVPLSTEETSKLGVLLDKLLDDGDIVEALRLQSIFNHRPLDLHFLVFSMALAEKLTNIYNLSQCERETLSNVVKNSIGQFRRRTLHRVRSTSTSSSPSKLNESSDTSSMLEFEEIPSREKQDVLEALQGLASRLNHGINIGKRIVTTYRAAMYLDKDYVDVLKAKEPKVLLKSATEDDCLQKLVVISDIFTSNQMSKMEIAEFLASEIATAVIRPRFYIFRTDQSSLHNKVPVSDVLWGFDLEKDFHLFLDLSTNTTLLGNTLLNYCDALKIYRKYQDKKDYEDDLKQNHQLPDIFDNLCQIIKNYGHPILSQGSNQVLSHKKQNIITVELLIKAHRCFVHECSMEGIANVLARAKALNSVVMAAKSWNVIVRLLTGIGRYREMYYCFDSLMKSGQFESLLSRSDKEKTPGFRNAVISYLREQCPEDTENLRMACISFLMYKELAVMWETEAKQMIEKLFEDFQEGIQRTVTSTPKTTEEIIKFSVSPQLMKQLNTIMGNFVNATENYLLDNKLLLAQKNASMAELVAMQIDLVNKASKSPSPQSKCICVLNISSSAVLKRLINEELSVPQSIILGRAYSHEINWNEAILQRYIMQGEEDYLNDFCMRLELSDSVIENLAKSFQTLSNISEKMEENMYKLVERVQLVTVKYRLASILGFRKIITEMINDDCCVHFLKDTNYGRNENLLEKS